jgi:hypothetical protein
MQCDSEIKQNSWVDGITIYVNKTIYLRKRPNIYYILQVAIFQAMNKIISLANIHHGSIKQHDVENKYENLQMMYDH